MDLLRTLQISASGLSAERTRLQTISSNIANAHTTRTEEGGPYLRKVPVFRASPVPGPDFGKIMDDKLAHPVVIDVVADQRAVETVYDPGHPDADPVTGLVAMPNVNIVEEMVDMVDASHAYEANVSALSAARNMALKALEIGR
jgi:flagellar basal-body rod protein FlgC